MRLFSSMVSAGLLVLSAASANAAQLIVNGGFESGNFTPSLVDPTYDVITQGGPQDLTGWTVGNSLVWGVNTTDINTHTGKGFVDLTGIGDTIPHGELNQTISTIAGQQYSFSVFLTQDFPSSIVGIDVFANGVALALLGTPGFWNYQPTGAAYGQMTSSFVANAPSTQISIRSIAFGSRVFMIGLDDVSVTGPAVSPVPLPGTLPFLASAIAGLGFVGWRKRRKAMGTVV
jgi:hypothetical protein